MADITPARAFNRAGAAGDSGTPGQLALKVFSGEVLKHLEDEKFVSSMTLQKMLKTGTKWQFIVTGTAVATDHQPFDNMITDEDAGGTPYLNSIKQGERLIHADKLLVAPFMIDGTDNQLLHWEQRQAYAEMAARAIHDKKERRAINMIYKASQVAADALFTGSRGGTTVIEEAATTDPEAFVDALFRMKQAFKEKNVPEFGRYCLVKPSQYRAFFTDGAGAMGNNLTWINKDYGTGGNFATGKIAMVAGFEIHEHNFLPDVAATYEGGTDNYFATGVEGNNYEVIIAANDTTGALCFQREAVGSVTVMGLSVTNVFKDEYNAWFVNPKLLSGCGILRPECAGLIREDT